MVLHERDQYRGLACPRGEVTKPKKLERLLGVIPQSGRATAEKSGRTGQKVSGLKSVRENSQISRVLRGRHPDGRKARARFLQRASRPEGPCVLRDLDSFGQKHKFPHPYSDAEESASS